MSTSLPAGSAPRRRLLRSDAETSHVAGHWRKLTHSAELMVDPGRGARCAIRDTRGVRARPLPLDRLQVFDETDPVAAGRTAELGETRADGALLAYVEGGEPSSHGRDNGSLARLFWRALDASDYWLTQTRLWAADQDPMPHTRERSGGGWDVTLAPLPSLVWPGSIIIAKPAPIPNPTHWRSTKCPGARPAEPSLA
jgi:hypothetical protein